MTLAVNNKDEVNPVVTSGATASAIDENSSANQAVYTVTATDFADLAHPNDGPSTPITYSLKAGQDASDFTISGGVVSLKASPNYETKDGYTFTVIATDAAGNTAEQVVTLAVNKVVSNNPASINGTNTASLREDGPVLSASGKLTVSDVDTGQDVFATPTSPLAGTYGTFTFNATTGDWGYTLNNSSTAVQNLALAESVTDKLTVTSQDGTASKELVVTITGAGELAPVLDLNSTDLGVAQSTKITFASSYDVGDVVTLTVDGAIYSHTVVAGATTGEAVYDALKASTDAGGTTLTNKLTSKGIASSSWAADLASNEVTLTGSAGASNAFTVSSGITNVAFIKTVDFSNQVYRFAGSSGSESITLTINGTSVSATTSEASVAGTSTSGTADDTRFDSTANFLVDKINAGNYGAKAYYSAATNTFTLSSSADQTTTGTSTASTSSGSNTVASGTSGTVSVSSQSAPLVTAVTTAANAPTSFQAAFTEMSGVDTGANAVAIVSSNVSIADGDSTTLQSASITIANHPDNALETLSISGNLPTGIIASSYNAVTGVLTLTGEASLADYQAALQAIRYNNASNNPNLADRIINITVNDGGNNSNTTVATVKVANANDVASINGTNTASLREDGPVLSASGKLTVSDVDTGQDVFATPTSPLAGTYGTFTFNATTGDWGYTLNNSSTAVQNLALAESVTDKLTVTSQDGTASKELVVTITGAGELAPVLDLNSTDLGVAQSTKITFASSYDVGDVVTLTVDGAIYSHTVVAGATTGEAVYDALKASTDAGGTTLTNKLTSKGIASSSWAADLASNEVTLTGSAGASNAFTVSSGITNVAFIKTVDFSNQVYRFAGSSGSESITLTINGTSVSATTSEASVAGTSTSGTADDTRFDSTANFLVDKINAGNYGAKAYYSAATNTFTLSSSADQTTTGTSTASTSSGSNTVASGTSGTVSVSSQSAPLVTAVTTAANAPTSFQAAFTEMSGVDTGANAVAIVSSNVSIADGDSTTLQSASITIANHPDNALETLSISGNLPTGIIASSYNAVTGVLTLTGEASLADYQAALQAIRYNNASNNPNLADRIINITVNDGGNNSNTTVATVKITAITDPIAMDLNGNGIEYVSRVVGVTHAYDATGDLATTAWVAPEDGLLAQLKSDGTHNIVFSTQAGETDLQGLAKVYDSNKDGVLDSSDTAFSQFGVWQDADSDGVVDSGEFLSLADRGITSLSLTSDGQIHFEANGDVIVYGQTTYTTSDGQLHIAEDVGFAVSDAYQPLDIAAIIANADALESVMHIDQLADTASSSTLMVELGGQTYEIATLPGQEVGAQDILPHFVGSDASAKLLGDRSWTEVIDISSDHGGPGSNVTAGGTLNDSSYANSDGDWTVIINSGDAKVDSINNQITFASESASNSVTIVTADGASHDINNVDKIQWHG